MNLLLSAVEGLIMIKRFFYHSPQDLCPTTLWDRWPRTRPLSCPSGPALDFPTILKPLCVCLWVLLHFLFTEKMLNFNETVQVFRKIDFFCLQLSPVDVFVHFWPFKIKQWFFYLTFIVGGRESYFSVVFLRTTCWLPDFYFISLKFVKNFH